MAVHSCDHIGPCSMDSAVNDISGRVDTMHVTTFNHFPLFGHQDQIVWRHVAERLAMRIDPEVIWHDGVADCDMAAGAFVVVAIDSEPTESGRVVQLSPGTFGFECSKFWDADVVNLVAYQTGRFVTAIREW